MHNHWAPCCILFQQPCAHWQSIFRSIDTTSPLQFLLLVRLGGPLNLAVRSHNITTETSYFTVTYAHTRMCLVDGTDTIGPYKCILEPVCRNTRFIHLLPYAFDRSMREPCAQECPGQLLHCCLNLGRHASFSGELHPLLLRNFGYCCFGCSPLDRDIGRFRFACSRLSRMHRMVRLGQAMGISGFGMATWSSFGLFRIFFVSYFRTSIDFHPCFTLLSMM